MSDYIIETENLSYIYQDENEETKDGEFVSALTDINLSVKKGEYIAILGHNGSGKSTLAKLLNLILTPTSGKIYIDGVDVTVENFNEDDVYEVRKKIGMVFQNPDNQLVATVVEEDVAFGPENLGLEHDEIKRRVHSSLKLVGMERYAKHAPHKLSGGQKQRVAIAGIIAMRPRVIIFDESTAMLDPLGRKEVVDIMERLWREENITVINITHYMNEAARAERVIIMNDGLIVADSTAKKVFADIKMLSDIGLEAPQGRELIYELKKSGYFIDTDAISADECTDALIGFLKSE